MLIFLDDISICSSTNEEHFERLALVFQQLASHDLKIQPIKCYLFQKCVLYLAQIISDQGISADPEKVKAVSEWPIPVNARELKAFLGTVGYHVNPHAIIGLSLFYHKFSHVPRLMIDIRLNSTASITIG